jgi:protein-S-isoprenylcysteine O-methyltransferase Ste14
MHLAGGLLIATGALLLARCIWEFAATGRGTLSPVDPPRELVVVGLYRYVRNPMYLSVGTILLGEVLLTRSMGLLGFAATGFVIVNLFVIGYEEPYLRRQFGGSYERYTARVGRWVPRFHREEVAP